MSWFPKNCVVVPIDFSDESFAAAEVAVTLVDEISHLHIIHVLEDELSAADPGVVWGTLDNETRIKNVKKAMTERFQGPGFAGSNFEVRVGHPVDEITDFAEEIGQEIIVIPSHGRRGITRLLMGSVAERVVRLAHCPVLVLRK